MIEGWKIIVAALFLAAIFCAVMAARGYLEIRRDSKRSTGK